LNADKAAEALMKAIPQSMSADLAATAQDQREADEADLLPRQSLRQALDLNAWFDCGRAAEIALGIAEALDWAHGCGTAHVSLLPESIFIGDDGEVFIADADQRDDLPARIAAQYMSPEEVRGEPADARSDLYALGVLLYEMLTDRVPFDGSDAEAIKHKHLHRTPEPPNIFRTDTPDTLSRLVMRLLDKQPDQRPQRAADLLAELQRVIEAETPAASANHLHDSPGSDIFVLADFEPAETSREHATTEEDSVLDLEFNDLFVTGTARVDDARLMNPADEDAEPFAEDAAASPDIEDLPSASREPELPMADADDELAATTRLTADKVERRPAPVIAESERDPFDLPTLAIIEPPASVAAASPPRTQLGLGAKFNEVEASVVEPGDARLRWLALLLMCIVAAAALLLYKVARPAATRPIEPAPPSQPASTPMQQAAPSAAHSQSDSPPTTATENGLRATPSNSPTTSNRSRRQGQSAARGSRSYAARPAAQVRRRVSGSFKGQPSKRRKRAWVRHALSQ
jgi:Protein kinase domain